MTSSQSVPKQQSQNLEIMNFAKFLKKFEVTETKKGSKLPAPNHPHS